MRSMCVHISSVVSGGRGKEHPTTHTDHFESCGLSAKPGVNVKAARLSAPQPYRHVSLVPNHNLMRPTPPPIHFTMRPQDVSGV